jgi:hypothetical protein
VPGIRLSFNPINPGSDFLPGDGNLKVIKDVRDSNFDVYLYLPHQTGQARHLFVSRIGLTIPGHPDDDKHHADADEPYSRSVGTPRIERRAERNACAQKTNADCDESSRIWFFFIVLSHIPSIDV